MDTAAPRPAATVVVVRPRRTEGGIEILVLERSAGSRLLPGFVVFPGGSIEDGDPDLAERWFADPGEVARACAVRELAEETGLALTSAGLVRVGAEAVQAVHANPPSADALAELARWVAPEELPVRFDARFFSLAASRGVDPEPDGVEAIRAWWAPVQEVLDRQQAGRATLAWPTFVTLRALSGCRGVEEVLALRIEQVAPGV